MTKFAIEGRVDGQWAREHVGDVNDSTLFGSREEAEAALPILANQLDCPERDLRVVRIDE